MRRGLLQSHFKVYDRVLHIPGKNASPWVCHPECVYAGWNPFLFSANLLFLKEKSTKLETNKLKSGSFQVSLFGEDRKSTVGSFTVSVVLAHFLKRHMGTVNTWRDFPALPAPHPSTYTPVCKPLLQMSVRPHHMPDCPGAPWCSGVWLFSKDRIETGT